RYYFIRLLPVVTPESVVRRFDKIIRPGECPSADAYRILLNKYYPATENCRDSSNTNRACVLKCGRAIAVMQSRENLFERQGFSVELPRWVVGLSAEHQNQGIRLNWTPEPTASSYRVWKRIAGAKVYPEWEVLAEHLRENSCLLKGVESGTFGVTAVTSSRKPLQGTLNFGEYLLFRADESPIVEQLILNHEGSRTETVSWTDESLPASQE